MLIFRFFLLYFLLIFNTPHVNGYVPYRLPDAKEVFVQVLINESHGTCVRSSSYIPGAERCTWILGRTFISMHTSTDDRFRYNMYYGYSDDLLTPIVNAYGGKVGVRTILRCRVRTQEAPEINWYRKTLHNSSCATLHRHIQTAEEIFCLEDRTRFHIRKKKHVSKLIFEKPTLEDSGLYMCVVSFGSRNITHSARVTFHELSTPAVRLVDSRKGNVGEGRVEIYFNRTWNRVHMYTWEPPEASLICRLLGYRHGGEPRFTFKDGNSFLEYSYRGRRNIYSPFIKLDCPMNSTRLQDCSGWNMTQRDGLPGGVTCRRTSVKIPNKRIRFTGTSPIEGRVEVFGNGYWGTICMKGLTAHDISTICKTLGHKFGGSMYKAWDTYYAGSTDLGPVMLTGLKCPPHATEFGQCSHNGVGNLCCNCTHSDDLAVRCNANPVTEESKEIRLAGYGRTDKGRVELFHNGAWVLVDPYWLQFPEANMFCKMLGFRYGGEPILKETVPPTHGIALIRYIDCPFNAIHISNCSVTYNPRASMSSNAQGGGVICRKEPLKVPSIPFRKATNQQGVEKLQYYKDGYWGTVCGAYIGTPEASMICSMMGFKNGGKLIKSNNDWSYRGLGPILLKYLDCPVNATDISQCAFRNYTERDHRSACYSYIDHRKDISISCNTESMELQDVLLRINGSSENNGILEVYHNNRWKFVSYFGESTLASVVCRQLGYRSGGEMYKSYICIDGPCDLSESLSGYTDCTGKEKNLGHCNTLKWTTYWPLYGRLTGIHCYEDEKPFEVKNTLNEAYEGEVILTKNDEEYKVCATRWDDIHARAVCRSLGYSEGIAKYNKAHRYVRYSTEKMIKNMYCERGAENLYQCFHSGWNSYDKDCFNAAPLTAAVKCFP